MLLKEVDVIVIVYKETEALTRNTLRKPQNDNWGIKLYNHLPGAVKNVPLNKSKIVV